MGYIAIFWVDCKIMSYIFGKLWDIFEYFWVDYELWQCRPLNTPPVMYRLGTCLL